MKRIKYDYEINQKVFIEPKQLNKLMNQYEGPYMVMTIWNNGTIIIFKATKHGAVYK